jgi:hypothetical protein
MFEENETVKNTFDRRNVLKGLLTLPVAVAAGAWINSCGKNNSNPKPDAVALDRSNAATAPTTVDFSVVLHGTYAVQFDTQNKQVQILIPTVLDSSGKEAHKYWSGLFRNETPYASSSSPTAISISASNPLPDVVTKTPVREDPTKFVILRKADLQQKPAGSGNPLRNVFQLPYPKALTVLRAQEFKAAGHKFFDSDTLIPKTPTQVPLAIALRYDLNVPGPFPVPNLHYHIFAEPLNQPGHPHITTAFAALTGLYVNVGGLKLSNDVTQDVDKPPTLAWLRDAQIPLPNGFDPVEPKSLEQRSGLSLPAGASHVGSCAGIITVSGPDA